MTQRAKPNRRWCWASLAAVSGLLSVACGDDAPSSSPSGGSVSVGGGSSSGSGQGGSLPNGGASDGSAGSVSPRGGNASGAASGSATGGSAAAGNATSGASSGSGGMAGAPSAPGPFKGVANSECADLRRLGASWWYNWVLSPGSCDAREFVPMIAGKSEKTAEAVTAALGKLKAAGYRTVLGFNEPNKADQANLSVAQVVELWPALTADADVRVGSPATSADAKAWFEDFMAEVAEKSLRVDFVAIHWYGWNAGSCVDAKELESYLVWAEKFRKPIWLTEFGCLNQSNPSAEVVQGFYASALEAFARHPSVERYAWYPWTANNELVKDGALTSLGDDFAAAPTAAPQ